MPDLKISYHGRTDVGIVRDHNEDAFGFFHPGGDSAGEGGASAEGADLIAVLSDGVGGHEAGELASSGAVAGVGAALAQLALAIHPDETDAVRERVETFMRGLNRNLHLLAKHQGQGSKNMAATLTAAWLGAGRITLVHAGDSRLYRWRGGQLEQLSIDDTQAGRAMAAGQLSEAEGRAKRDWHVIQRAMGVEDAKFAVTVQFWPVEDGDAYLLCSDGLTDGLSHAQLEKGFARLDAAEPATFTEHLIEAGNQASGKDNITVCLMRVGAGWTAASRRPENRPIPAAPTMNTKHTIALYVLFVLLLLGLGGLGYALIKSSQSNRAALSEVSALQAEQADEASTRFSQIEMTLGRYDEDRIKMDRRYRALLTELGNELTGLETNLVSTLEQQKSEGNKAGEALARQLQALEQSQQRLREGVQAAGQKAASVAGQLEGIWSRFDQQKEAFAELRQRVAAIELPTPQAERLEQILETSEPEVVEPEQAVESIEPEAAAESVEAEPTTPEPGNATEEP